MFETSTNRLIETELEEIVKEIERKSPSFSILAARRFAYRLLQTPIQIEVAESRQLNVLENFVFRAGVELNPPTTEEELADVLGLDSVFIKNTTATLRHLHTLEADTKYIKLTSVGQEFYHNRSVPKSPETITIYSISQPFDDLPSLSDSQIENKNQQVDRLTNLTDLVTIENNFTSISTLSLSQLRELIQNSNLDFHSPENGKFITSLTVEDKLEVIWKPLSIIVIFDILENQIKIQAREEKHILEDTSIWLNNLLAEDKISLNILCQLTDEEIND